MTLNLFISYRSTDSAKVDTLVARLRSLTLPDGKTPRYKVWQDKTDITPGEDWWQAIVNGIIGAQVLVYMVSQASAVNVNCRAELAYARKRNRAILPLVLDGEFFYNPQSGKNDIRYWSDIPEQLNDLRAQFLFYEGADFINQVNKAMDAFAAKGFRDIPADFPPDPRPDVAAAKNTLAIYDQACDAALHMDLAGAERLFQRLIDWRDPDFGEAALGWMAIVRAYQKIVEFDAREASRFKVPSLWATYRALFPKPYVSFFDPRNLQERYNDAARLTPSAPPPAPTTPPVRTATPPPQPKRIMSLAEASAAVRQIIGEPFEWCEVPAGPFIFGQGETQQTLDLPTFWIAKHPITYSQFQTFVDATDGIGDDRWWEGLAADADARKLVEPKWKVAKHPRETVSWYQCMAFSRWLSYRLGGAYASHQWAEWVVRLPLETEWEKAARGTDGREFPWGNGFDKTKCNTSESGLKKTTPVDQYPQGASPYGVFDMSGNVKEWCLDEYSNTDSIDILNANRRVLRGGSWSRLDNFARAAVRVSYNPYSRNYDDVGGRVVCVRLPSP